MARRSFDFDSTSHKLGLNSKAKKKFSSKDPIDDFSEYVDLGLPSGTLWCKHNVGADSEEDFGDFFSFEDIKSLEFQGGASVPSREDIVELVEFTYTDFFTIDGKEYVRVCSKKDTSRSIIFPFSGYINSSEVHEGRGKIGAVWSREEYVSKFSFMLMFSQYSHHIMLGENQQDVKVPTRTIIKKPLLMKESKKIKLGLNKIAKKKFDEEGQKEIENDLGQAGLVDYLAEKIQEIVGKQVIPAGIKDKKTDEVTSYSLSWEENSFITNVVYLKFHEDHISAMIKIFTRNPRNNNFFQSKKPIDNIPILSRGMEIILHEIKKILKIDESHSMSLGLNKKAKKEFSDDSVSRPLASIDVKPIVEEFEERLKSILSQHVKLDVLVEGEDTDDVIYSFYWSQRFNDFVINRIILEIFNQEEFTYDLQLFKKNVKYHNSERRPKNLMWSELEKVIKEIGDHTDTISASESFKLGLNKRAKDQFDKTDAVEALSDYVDLGLPSGTLWCKYNIGAVSEEDCGTYKSFYELDAMRGDLQKCEIPSKSDFYELRSCTTQSIEEINDKRCVEFKSKVNGKSIVLPLGGYFHVMSGEYVSTQTTGYYWESNEKDKDIAYLFYMNGVTLESSESCMRHKKYKQCVRLVSKREEINEKNLGFGLNKRAKEIHSNTDAIDNLHQISFADSEVERICNEHGVYTYGDAREVSSLEGWFSDNKDIKSFNELKHFTGLSSIEYSAFSGCSYLKEVTIPDSVTSIGDYAFYGCETLQGIIIPDRVTLIGEGAFCRCKSLTSLIIPHGVTRIGIGAFNYCDKIVTVVIPDGVTAIGDYAFAECKSLQTINIPDSVTDIGEEAFGTCEALKTIIIPGSVSTIKSKTFYHCSRLQSITIQQGVKTIRHLVFSHCEALKEIAFPDSVIDIDNDAFYFTNNLKKIYISKNSKALAKVKVGDNNIEVVDPSEMNEAHALGLNSRAKKTFNDTDAVENIATIQFEDPEVERICHEHGVYSYDDAREVTSIEGWFKENSDMESFNELKLFTGLKEIEECAFELCKSLKSITIPSTVTRIGLNTFYWCKTLQSINIPSRVASIEKYAFYGCDSLQSINIPDGVTSIGDGAFFGCESLQSITIPDSVTSIGYQVFQYCKALQSINIPDSVTSIRYSAFFKCRSLETINIPDSVTSIEKYAFYGCESLNTIYISKRCPVYKDIKKAYPKIKLVDPSEMNESHALGLNKHAKKQHGETDAVENIATIRFEDPIIEKVMHKFGIFTYEDAMDTDDETLEKIIGGLRNDNLYKDVKSFNEFKYFTRIERVNIPWMFKDFVNMKSIELPAKATTIGMYAFNNTGIRSVKIPSTLKIIGSSSFRGSNYLETVEFAPNGESSLVHISNDAFCGCTSLKKIRIPEGVQNIGYQAFLNCASLEEVWLPSSILVFGDDDHDIFLNVNPNIIVHCSPQMLPDVENTVKICVEKNVNGKIVKDYS